MRLSAGTRLGPYEILAPLGAGGMGEVYRATDTNLKRQVAIKVLPAAVAADGERLARFQREAEVLAALNHPNIAHIHGLEKSDGTIALVMELVEGPTLADRIAQGAIPVDEALPIAKQIAEALEAAHEQGIIHRDLKPANIAFTADGQVKVLDFGLAKAMDMSGGGRAEVTASPTMTSPGAMTAVGIILGTAAYMSPEQARGLTVDKRTDIWAFGCVLYELLTRRRAFPGTTITDTLAAILAREPDWRGLPEATPLGVRRLLRRCLQKNPVLRLRDVGDARIELLAGEDVDAAPQSRARGITWTPTKIIAVLAASMVVIGASVVIGMWLRPRTLPVSRPVQVRFAVSPPVGGAFAIDFERIFLALSPDGSQLAFIATLEGGPSRIWVRPVSAVDAHVVSGTEGAGSLFWSPDGGSLAFFAGNKLKRIDLRNRAAVAICDVPEGVGLSGSWGVNNEILFASVEGDAIYSVPTAGGTPIALVQPDRLRGEARVNWPWFLPDGKQFLHLTRLRDGSGQLTVAERGRPSKPILPGVSNVQWVDPDYLVFAREGTLVAQRFDLAKQRVVGEPFAIADSVNYSFSTARGMFTTSRTGMLAYQSYQDVDRLVWSDRAGIERGALGTAGGYQSVRISPDGGTLLFDRIQPGLGSFDLWTRDIARGVETRLTSDPSSESNGVWLPGGRAVVFMADRGGPPHLFRKDLVTGAEEELLPVGRLQLALDVWADRNALVYKERTARGNFNLLLLPLTKPATPSSLLASRFDEQAARVAPDGRALAFASDESGQYEVYVAPLPLTGAKTRVSTGGARRPLWTPDGRELIYLTADRTLLSVRVRTGPSLELGTPTPLFHLKAGTGWRDFDVSRDGNRFIAVVSEVRAAEQPVTLVLNGIADSAR